MGKVIGGSTGKSHQRIFHHQTERAEQFEVFGIVRDQRMPFGKALRRKQGVFTGQGPADGFQARDNPLSLLQINAKFWEMYEG